jgi:hypothetical protein
MKRIQEIAYYKIGGAIILRVSFIRGSSYGASKWD